MIDKQFEDLPAAYRKQIPDAKEIYEVKPTATCPTGTQGRVAVMEVLEMDKEIEQVILKDPTEGAIYKAARAKGMMTMKEDAIIKAMQKIIPFEEVNTL
jgi:type II secretory ATPase GspE/PulE/Tfp pilus assembly ATPase PilB-like protein